MAAITTNAAASPLALAPVPEPMDERRAFVDPAAFVRSEADGLLHLDLAVRGARCAGCLAKIEKGLAGLDSVRTARLNLTTGKLHVAWADAAFRPAQLTEKLANLGYHAVPYEADRESDLRRDEERDLLRCLAVAGFAAANVMLLSVALWGGDGEMGPATRELMQWISAAIALPAVVYSGRPFFRSAWAALRGGHANMDVPISLAVTLACVLSVVVMLRGHLETYFEAPVTLLFFLLIGRVLDLRLRGRARSAAAHLAALQTQTANRVESSGAIIAVLSRDIRPDDRILVGAGDRIPVNGVVDEGTSVLNTSLVTGETTPETVSVGSAVYSGALNLAQPFYMRATAVEGNSLLAEIGRLIEDGARSRAGYVRLADQAASLYVPMVHSLAFLTFVGWALFGAAGIETAFVNAIAVLIITCPCALGLAVPVVQIVANGRLFERGVLVKGGEALERLAQADMAVFDKTGTLTEPELRIVADGENARNLELAAGLARVSRHPLAVALARHVGPGVAAANAQEQLGAGLSAVIDGRTVRLGSRAWCGLDESAAPEGPELWLRTEEMPPVSFRFAETLKPSAGPVVTGLVRRGLTVEMLSGDAVGAVGQIAQQMGIRSYHGRQKPGDKVSHLVALKREGRRVLMVGDGLNDAPSLANAHVSISPANAVEASRASADIVLQSGDLTPVLDAVDVARAARRRGLENLGFAALYNAVAIPLAMSGMVTPLIAAIAMSSSSLIVTANALRLAHMKLQAQSRKLAP